MRIALALILLVFMLPVKASEFWSKLWLNADQRGEALLQEGDASNAAKEYADPRRKAYAKLKAGDYQGAAHDLENLHDSEADYNRGNALAHAGDLHRALEAYDAALKSDPDNQDARHNRELVAKALEQPPPQQQNDDGKKSQDGKKEGQQDKQGEQNSQGKDSQGKNSQEGKSSQSDNKPGKGQNSSAQNKPEQPGKAGGKTQDGKKQNDQAQHGKPQDGKQTKKEESGQQAQSPEKSAAQSGQAGKQTRAKDDAERARRDAEASFARPAADGKNGAKMGDEANTTSAKPATARKTEQQIAQEQWLRSIPDNPGGLLQRKFMIQHLMRQREAQQ
ncbi:TPR domain protein in aerotolerance operon [Candidatus Nitrotoga sp. BS]|nr:TPR domain protein in aerotolerance operon [Candidatus Nitrotoga sp. BS]